MGDFAKSILSAPLATLFVVAGILFLLIAVVGKFSGKIDPGNMGRIASGALGLAFVSIGLTIHLFSNGWQTAVTPPPPSQSASGPVAGTSLADKTQKTPDSNAPPAPTTASPPSVIESTEAEPNDNMATRNVIAEGMTIQGSLAKETDRDYFEFKATGAKVRVTLRKDFDARIEVYDSKEIGLADDSRLGFTTLSMSFETEANSTYFLIVEARYPGQKGKYELTLRPE